MDVKIRRQLSVQMSKVWKDTLSKLKGSDKTKLLSDVRYDFIDNLDDMLENWGYGRRFSDEMKYAEEPEYKANINIDSYIPIEDSRPERVVEEHSQDTLAKLDTIYRQDKPLSLEEECDKYRDSIQLPRHKRLRKTNADKRGDKTNQGK